MQRRDYRPTMLSTYQAVISNVLLNVPSPSSVSRSTTFIKQEPALTLKHALIDRDLTVANAEYDINAFSPVTKIWLTYRSKITVQLSHDRAATMHHAYATRMRNILRFAQHSCVIRSKHGQWPQVRFHINVILCGPKTSAVLLFNEVFTGVTRGGWGRQSLGTRGLM